MFTSKNFDFKKAIFIFGLVLLILTSGCVTITIDHKIMSDGNSKITLTYDYSQFAQIAASYGQSTADLDTNIRTQCNEFNKKVSEAGWKNAKCEVKDKKMIISGEFNIEDNPTFAPHFEIIQGIPYTTYKYNAKAILVSLKSTDSNFSASNLKMMKTLYSSAGVNLTYNVEMPGKVTKAEVGKIEGENKVIIDLFDLAEKQSAYIESQELNMFAVGVIIIVIALLLLVLFLVLKKSTKSATTTQQQTTQQYSQQSYQYPYQNKP
ncbi:MAG: hypothetical protein QXM75_00755 [Candidatus Diapherotrites archaeon]